MSKICCVLGFLMWVAGCGELPPGLDEYCPDDPLAKDCPEGDCGGPYPCLSYCVRYFPEGEDIPESGLGEWCDDLPEDFDMGGFCEENNTVNGCAEWCVNHPARCDNSICGDSACTGQEWASSCPEDCEAICGDDACTHDETAFTCQTDCEPVCGDSACTGDETYDLCPQDCPPDCGDHLCDDNESPILCPVDCPPVCGDGECTHDENASSCIDDCEALCGDHICSPGEDPSNCIMDCPADCGDDDCSPGETASSCPNDCESVCGDSACTHDEDSSSCPADCSASCGDALCTGSESPSNCPRDCPAECGDGVVTHDELCEGAETHWCDTTCGSEGTLACVDCFWGEVCTPPVERCNGIDDDCVDGADNGFECARGTEEDCETTCGTTGSRVCDSACEWPDVCTPPAEECNRLDDDCDGNLDEDFECIWGTETDCTTSCGSTGTRTCDRSCEWDTTCALPGESCNGFDDDCDTTVDEGCACDGDFVQESLPASASSYTVADVDGTSWDNIIIAARSATGGAFYRYDGDSWSLMVSSASIIPNALTVNSEDDATAVGQSGAIAHYDGESWSSLDSPTPNNLNGIHRNFAVGEDGTILVRQDGVWSTMVCPVSARSEEFNDVRSGSGIAVAVGTNGTVITYEGGEWQEVSSGVASVLSSIALVGSSFIAVGGPDIIMGDGTSWVEVVNPAGFSWLQDVWGTPDNGTGTEIFVVGSRGTILRHTGSFDGIHRPSFELLSGSEVGELPTYTNVWGSLLRDDTTDNVYISSGSLLLHQCGED